MKTLSTRRQVVTTAKIAADPSHAGTAQKQFRAHVPEIRSPVYSLMFVHVNDLETVRYLTLS